MRAKSKMKLSNFHLNLLLLLLVLESPPFVISFNCNGHCPLGQKCKKQKSPDLNFCLLVSIITKKMGPMNPPKPFFNDDDDDDDHK